MNEIRDIVLIGAGNLASHLGAGLTAQGLHIVQVYNRAPGRGQDLALKLGASFTGSLDHLTRSADLYILAVSDSAIAEVAAGLHLEDRLVVHTSGSVGMDVLDVASRYTGVFYFLQTFSPGRPVNFREIPVCIEANTPEGTRRLEELAGRLSGMVRLVDSRDRMLIHLCAVFVSNFPNFMYTVAEDIMKQGEIPFGMLKPLMEQTTANAVMGDAFTRQTGPAFRGDMAVLEKHRQLLAGHPEFLEIYELISRNIIKYKSTHGKL